MQSCDTTTTQVGEKPILLTIITIEDCVQILNNIVVILVDVQGLSIREYKTMQVRHSLENVQIGGKPYLLKVININKRISIDYMKIPKNEGQ